MLGTKTVRKKAVLNDPRLQDLRLRQDNKKVKKSFGISNQEGISNAPFKEDKILSEKDRYF